MLTLNENANLSYDKADFEKRYLKYKKLHEAEEPVKADDGKEAISATIADMIKASWDLIDRCNAAVSTMHYYNREDLTQAFVEMIDNSYINIGQLEKALENVVPAAEKIDDGKAEVEPEVESLKEAKYSCTFDDEEIGQVEADSDEEAYEKMEKELPELPYGKHDGMANCEREDDIYDVEVQQGEDLIG